MGFPVTLGQKSQYKPMTLHIDQTSFLDGQGQEMGKMIEDVSGACNISVHTGSVEVPPGNTECKHNCVVRLQSAANWLALEPARLENHAKPVFAEPPIKSQPFADGKREQ